MTTSTWQQRAEAHHKELSPITSAYRDRKARGQLHPVHDFLFSYYPYTAGKLEQWHPPIGEILPLQGSFPDHFRQKHYYLDKSSATLDPTVLREKDLARLRFSRQLLELTHNRAPNFGCYGLHEWAMVYQSKDVRHGERAPLRLSTTEIKDFVDSQTLACSHFDAVRFFTPAAAPRNRLQPTLDTRKDYEQPGCIHANMDLYKWSFKAMPWVGSDILRKTFFLANDLRELDMRASPYDLSSYGYSPITIETSAGRAEYVKIQQTLAKQATRLRAEVIGALDSIFEQVTFQHPTPLQSITTQP